MDLSAVLEIIKHLPDSLPDFAILGLLIFLFLTKRKDVEATNIIAISELQTNQMSTLIEQNSALAKELHSVRAELQSAYAIIDDMRSRIVELEEAVKNKGK